MSEPYKPVFNTNNLDLPKLETLEEMYELKGETTT